MQQDEYPIAEYDQYYEECHQSKPVLARLYEHDRQKKQKLEKMRQARQAQELSHVLAKPQISQNTRQILANTTSNLPSYKDVQHYFTKQKHIEDLKRLYEIDRLKEVTGHPKISSRAKSLNRDLTDLQDWQRKQQTKIEESRQMKEHQERLQLEEMKKHQKYVNKGSKRIMQGKENVYGSIEERLIQAGQMKKQRQDLKVKEREREHREQADIATTGAGKKVRKSSQMRSETSQLSMKSEELELLSQNKQRQDLFKKYYQEKKKEAESKMLSSTMLNSVFSMSPVGQVYHQQIPEFTQPQMSNSLCYIQNYPLMSPSAAISFQSQPEPIKPMTYCSFGSLQSQRHDSLPTFQAPSITQDVYQLLRSAHDNSQEKLSIASTSCFDQQHQMTKPSTKASSTKQSVMQLMKPTEASKNKSRTRETQQELVNSKSPQKREIYQSKRQGSRSDRGNIPTNTHLYERNRQWSQERQRRLEQEQEKVNLLNTLKCTFKPQISENSKRLMSPSQERPNRQNRLRVYDYDRNVNFDKRLLHQLANSQISPLKESSESFVSNHQEFKDPFLEQFSVGCGGGMKQMMKTMDDQSTEKLIMQPPEGWYRQQQMAGYNQIGCYNRDLLL